jgi:CCR4-NOT transcription complex subunit 6
MESFADDCSEVNLSGHELHELPDDTFSRFIALTTLRISNCSLSDLPSSLFSVQTLEHLDISNNILRIIPLELGFLPSLKTLSIRGNPGASSVPFCDLIDDHPTLISFLNRAVAAVPPPAARAFRPPVTSPSTFTFLSYNILSPACTSHPAYPLSLGRFLDPSYRLPFIQNQIFQLNPDIVCLQEVETSLYRDVFAPLMQSRGFAGVHAPKGRANTMDDPERRDRVIGQATFVNTQKFELVNSRTFVLRSHRLAAGLDNASEVAPHDEVSVMAFVRSKTAKRANIVIVNLHLFWELPADRVRAAQLYLAVEAALEFGAENAAEFDVILTGDLNAEAGSMALAYLWGRGDFVSAYPIEVPLRTFTQWPQNCPFRQVDHIFTSCYGIRPVSFLEGDDPQAVASRYLAIPAEHYPSDHIPIAAVFAVAEQPAYPPPRQITPVQVQAPAVESPKFVITRPVKKGGLSIVTRPKP